VTRDMTLRTLRALKRVGRLPFCVAMDLSNEADNGVDDKKDQR